MRDHDLGPSVQFERRLPLSPVAASEARTAVDDLRGVEAETLDCVRLLVSELVTNAIRHGKMREGDEIVLRVKADHDCLRVEVGQPTDGFGKKGPPRPARDGASGWGLFLVDALAQRWGVDHRDGTRVWFEIDRTDPTVSRLDQRSGSVQARKQ